MWYNRDINTNIKDFVMPISIMIKPASSACNLRCEYCFYADVSDNRQEKNKGIMSLDTARSIIKSAFEFSKDNVFFTFQGGEPLLAGVDYFNSFIDMVKEYKGKANVSFALQTNGTLINDEWCKLFKDNRFLIGVSLDGDEEINSYRKYPDGSSSFNDVMKGIELLKKYDVPFNILSVLTSRTAQNFRKTYRFFKSNDLRYLQYIPCLKPFGSDDNEYSMTTEDYEGYLNSAYKLYYNDSFRVGVSIRQFDNYRLLSQGQNAEQCGMNGVCSNQFVIEGDGSIYPCDFYCTDEWLLGNINDTSFEEAYNSKKAVEFIKDSFKLKDECKECEYFQLCRGGGCKRNKEAYDYCKAYKSFFEKNKDYWR